MDLNKFKSLVFNRNNLITFLVLILISWQQLPILYNNFKARGVILEKKIYVPIYHPAKMESVLFPPENKRALTIFWATWCAPCKLEMNRLKSSVENGHIKSDQIFAINPFEDSNVVRAFLLKKPFPFIFIEDLGLSNILNIKATPTTLFIDKGAVDSSSSGMSLIGIWRAENYLN